MRERLHCCPDNAGSRTFCGSQNNKALNEIVLVDVIPCELCVGSAKYPMGLPNAAETGHMKFGTWETRDV